MERLYIVCIFIIPYLASAGDEPKTLMRQHLSAMSRLSSERFSQLFKPKSDSEQQSPHRRNRSRSLPDVKAAFLRNHNQTSSSSLGDASSSSGDSDIDSSLGDTDKSGIDIADENIEIISAEGMNLFDYYLANPKYHARKEKFYNPALEKLEMAADCGNKQALEYLLTQVYVKVFKKFNQEKVECIEKWVETSGDSDVEKLLFDLRVERLENFYKRYTFYGFLKLAPKLNEFFLKSKEFDEAVVDGFEKEVEVLKGLESICGDKHQKSFIGMVFKDKMLVPGIEGYEQNIEEMAPVTRRPSVFKNPLTLRKKAG